MQEPPNPAGKAEKSSELIESPKSIEASKQSEEFTPPEYTMKEILAAIPPHCHERNTLLSIGYVLRDFLFVAILVSVATQIPSIPNPNFRILAWALYAFIQGLIFTGLWELAHECGHQALSPSKNVNNAMGLTIHSLLLVPYYSWRITHSQHHKSTNNLDRDIAFVPTLKTDYDAERRTHSKAWDMVEDTPAVALVTLFFHQLIAFPLYLTINNFALERMRAFAWWKRSHFYLGGDGPNFKPENWRSILISDLGIAAMAIALWGGVVRFGGWNVMLFYGFPYLWTNHWIRTSSSFLYLFKCTH
jgi:fatty acid desaturase